MKGLISNLGHGGGSHQDFKAFSQVEMIVFVEFTMLNGLMPSMRFEYEFKTQEEDPVTGNYLFLRSFVDDENRRWKEFESCFSLIDYRVIPP